MTYFKAIFLVLCLSTFNSYASDTFTNLDKELAVFKPYLGTWQADFKVPEGAKKIQDVGRWERALNGKAIHTKHSINEGEYFTTAGFYTKGTMKVLSPTQFVAYEDVTGSQDGITKVKSMSELKDDKFLVSTSYLKKGEWTKPEQRIYTRSTKTVKFK